MVYLQFPRHPNTPRRCLGLFLGSKYLLRRCLDVFGMVYSKIYQKDQPHVSKIYHTLGIQSYSKISDDDWFVQSLDLNA